MSYDQLELITKLNQYLNTNHRGVQLNTTGYCHGLTLLWLYKMQNNNEAGFNSLIKKIVNARFPLSAEDTVEIEKFISYIEWFQQPDHYMKNVSQMDTDVTTEIPKALSFSSIFNRAQLITALKLIAQNNKMICLSGPDHTIGVYRRNDVFYIYNANYPTGVAKEVPSIEELAKHILKDLYIDFGISTQEFALSVNVMGDAIDSALQKTLRDDLLATKQAAEEHCPVGMTPLYLACENHDVTLIDFLLKKKINMNPVNNKGWSPLLYACAVGYEDVAAMLLTRGANPNLVAQGGHPLFMAARCGNFAIVQSLLEHGAFTNLKDKHGNTALMGAVTGNQLAIVALLLKHGADTNLQNENKEMALDIALRQKQWGIVAMLLTRTLTFTIQQEKTINAYCSLIQKAAQGLEKTQGIDKNDKDKILRRLAITRVAANSSSFFSHTPVLSLHNPLRLLRKVF